MAYTQPTATLTAVRLSGAFVLRQLFKLAHREYAIVRRSDEADYLITALQIADLLPSLRRCLCFADIDWGVPIGGKANAERHVTLPTIRTLPGYCLATAVVVAKLAPVCPDSSWPVSLTLARPRQRRRWPGRHGRHVDGRRCPGRRVRYGAQGIRAGLPGGRRPRDQRRLLTDGNNATYNSDFDLSATS